MCLTPEPWKWSVSALSFSPEDADALIASALAIKDPDFALKRSSTGTKGVEVSNTERMAARRRFPPWFTRSASDG